MSTFCWILQNHFSCYHVTTPTHPSHLPASVCFMTILFSAAYTCLSLQRVRLGDWVLPYFLVQKAECLGVSASFYHKARCGEDHTHSHFPGLLPAFLVRTHYHSSPIIELFQHAFSSALTLETLASCARYSPSQLSLLNHRTLTCS